MTTLFGRLGHRAGLTVAERHALLVYAIDLHREGVRVNEIESSLVDRGATAEEAQAISADAASRSMREAAAAVDLPDAARLPVNLYFALGVTPRASTERIRGAYRRRAREVHPDHHQGEVDGASWNHLMSVVKNAEQVLSDSASRRAYDVHWLLRSRQVTAAQATDKERRGDWDTRYHWYMAELAEIEERLEVSTGVLAELPVNLSRAMAEVLATLDDYEDRVLHIRNQTYGVPETYQDLPRRVRGELQRKDATVVELRRLLDPERGAAGSWAEDVSRARQRLAQTGVAHRRFEIQELASGLAA